MIIRFRAWAWILLLNSTTLCPSCSFADEPPYPCKRRPEIRVGHAELEVRADSGQWIKFENAEDSGEQTVKNEFSGCVAERFLLVRHHYWEGIGFTLIDRENGNLTKLINDPVSSPDGQWIAEAGIDDEGFGVPEGFRIWSIGKNGLELRFDYAGARAWAPSWISPTQVQICVPVSPGLSCGREVIAISKGVWAPQRLDASSQTGGTAASLFDFSRAEGMKSEIYEVDPAALAITTRDFGSFIPQVRSPNMDVELDAEGAFWVATGAGIKVFNPDATPRAVLPGKGPLLHDAKRNRMWMEASYYDYSAKKIMDVPAVEAPVYGARLFREGDDVFMVDEKGVFRYADEAIRWERIYRDSETVHSAVFWGTTLYVGRRNGLFKVENGIRAEKCLFVADYVWDLVPFQGRILIASSNGYAELDPATDTIDRFPDVAEISSHLRRIIPYGDNVFLATGNWFLTFFDRKNRKTFRLEGEGQPAYYVRDAVFTPDQNWFAGTNNVIRYDVRQKRWLPVGEGLDALPFQEGLQGRRLAYADGKLWGAISLGVASYDIPHGRYSRIGAPVNPTHLNYLAVMGDYVWLDQYILEISTRKWKLLSSDDGMPSPVFRGAAFDENEIWVASQGPAGTSSSKPTVLTVFDRRSGRVLRSYRVDVDVDRLVMGREKLYIFGGNGAIMVDRNSGTAAALGLDAPGNVRDLVYDGESTLVLTDESIVKLGPSGDAQGKWPSPAPRGADRILANRWGDVLVVAKNELFALQSSNWMELGRQTSVGGRPGQGFSAISDVVLADDNRVAWVLTESGLVAVHLDKIR